MGDSGVPGASLGLTLDFLVRQGAQAWAVRRRLLPDCLAGSESATDMVMQDGLIVSSHHCVPSRQSTDPCPAQADSKA